MSLADALFDREPASNLVLRDGIVAAVSPLTVIVPPSTVASPAAKLDSYGPAVGDFVQVLVQGANRLVVGSAGNATGTYTPALVGAAIGTGGGAANTATYTRTGDLLFVDGHIVFGTSGATLPTGPVEVALPSGMTAAITNFDHGFPSFVQYVDTNGPDFLGTVGVANANTHVRLFATNSASTYDVRAQLSATIPIPWASPDGIFYQYMLRVN